MGASEPIRVEGMVRAVSEPPPGSAQVEIGGKQYAQTRDGWIEISVDERIVRVTLQRTACSGEIDRTNGGWRDLEPTLLEPIADTYTPFSPVAIAAVIPKVGDRVEVYGVAIATSDAETSFRDAPATTVTRIRALLLGRNASLDDAIREAYPQLERPEIRDQRATWKSWIGSAVMLALAAIVLAAWHMSAVAVGFCGCALLVRPRLAHPFRSAAEPEPYSPIAFLFFRVFGYALPGMVLAVGFRLQSQRFASWFVTGYFVAGIALAVANLKVLAPFRRLLAAAPWTGGAQDEVRIEGTVADSTPTRDEGAALARVEQWDRGSVGGSDASMKSASFVNIGTFTILSKSGDVIVDPAETQWASSVVTKRDGQDKDEFILTELIPIGGNAVAVGSIVDGRLRSKGTAPALVLATSRDGNPIALARSLIRHDVVTLVGIAIVAVVSALLALR